METAERHALIRQYADGYGLVMDALDGITAAEWDATEAPGEWSPRQVAHHLADSEMTSAVRIRRVLAEDAPLLMNYDQDEYAARLHYERPPEASLQAFRWARESTAQIIALLTEADWQRSGIHSESGIYSVEHWLRTYVEHAAMHADQIRRARAAGK